MSNVVINNKVRNISTYKDGVRTAYEKLLTSNWFVWGEFKTITKDELIKRLEEADSYTIDLED